MTLAQPVGSMAKSAVGSPHTHSAGYKFDLDIGGTANTFAVKTLNYGPVPEAYAASGEPSIDLAGVAYASPDTYYYKTEKITSEGSWDMDGDMTWTSPDSCVTSTIRTQLCPPPWTTGTPEASDTRPP